MKISFIIIIILSTLSIYVESKSLVLDTDGMPLVTYRNYYIVPAVSGSGGGVKLSPTTLNQTCPLDVAQENNEQLDGSPQTFLLAIPNRDGVIRQSQDLNIIFSNETTCGLPAVWRVEDSNGQRVVTSNGTVGNPGVETINNWFKIEKFDNDYKIVFCPTVCNTCSPTCGEVGSTIAKNGRRSVLKDVVGRPRRIFFWHCFPDGIDVCKIKPLLNHGNLRSCFPGWGGLGGSRETRRDSRVAAFRRIRVGSWNVGSLTGKRLKLVDALERHTVDIACFQETKWKGSSNIEGNGYKLWYLGSPTSINGVGVILKACLKDKVVLVNRCSDRIISLTLVIDGETVNVISAYEPQVGLSEVEKKTFWDSLDKVVREFLTDQRLILRGDLNGHIGAATEGYTGVYRGFGFVNSHFKKRVHHLVTFQSGGRCTKIDYLLVRRGDLKACKDCRVFPRETCSSQHNLLTMDILFKSVQRKREGSALPRILWKNLIGDTTEAFRSRVADGVSTRVEALVTCDANFMWNTLASIIKDAAKDTLRVAIGTSKTHTARRESWWLSKKVQAVVAAKQARFMELLSCREGNEEERVRAHERYKEAKRQAKKVIAQAKEKAYEDLYKKLDTKEGANDIFRIAKAREKRRRDLGDICFIKDEEGQTITDEEEIKKRWREYFSSLFNARVREEYKEDLEKAYDSVPRELIWKTLVDKGTSKRYIKVIRDMYDGAKTRVQSSIRNTEFFPVDVGLHQGSAISPYLFALIIDELSREIQEDIPCNGEITNNEKVDVCIGDKILQPKESFRYIRSMLHKSGRIEEDVSNQIKAAWMKWRAAAGVLCDKKIPLKLKGKFYRVAIRPAMLYGSECWPITKALANRVELAKLRMLIWTCGKTLLDMIPNEVYRARRPQSASVRRVEVLVVDGLRRRGRPKLRWEDRVKHDMKELLLSEDMTSDRNELERWARVRLEGACVFLWFCMPVCCCGQLRLVLSTEDKENYLEHPIPAAPVASPGQQVPPQAIAAHAAWVKRQKKVAVLMLLTMDLEIQRNLAHLGAYDMLQELKAMYSKQAEQELLQTVREFHTFKHVEGQYVSSHVLKMKGYIDELYRCVHFHPRRSFS
nr:hypothetical protein [Tanacetum cinerariifolium]